MKLIYTIITILLFNYSVIKTFESNLYEPYRQDYSIKTEHCVHNPDLRLCNTPFKQLDKYNFYGIH